MTIKRIFIIVSAIFGLGLIYLIQKDIQMLFDGWFSSRYVAFAMSRTFRFLINDLLVIQIIYGLFYEKKYVIFAFYVQLAGVILILLPYLTIKAFTGYNGPLISFMHRLIVNPLLMLLLIPAFYYQNKISKHE
jgi:exosortase F-associated protein